MSERTTIGLKLYLEFFEDDIGRHGGDAVVTNNARRHHGPGIAVPVCPLLSDDLFAAASFTQLNSEMLSQLVHRTNTILRGSRPFIPLPSSLGSSQCSHIFRAYSWSSESQTANWSHLNDIYGRAVDVKPRELPNSPDERWAMQSRSRIAGLKQPKGPYAGMAIFSPSNLMFFSYISLGRSIEVKNGNVADALNKLQYTLQRNKVVTELRLTERHEKKGYKRRRLSSKRWRKRFAHEVWASFLWCDVS